MKKLICIGLLFVMGLSACHKKEVFVEKTITPLKLNFGEEKEVSITRSNGSSTSYRITFVKAVENRCTPKFCMTYYGTECLKSAMTATFVIQSTYLGSDTLSLKRYACIGNEDLSLDDNFIDKKPFKDITIGLSNTNPRMDDSTIALKDYYVKLLIERI